ncbi:ATP phosphoribosyltransferase regulatory subunit [Pueribacillus theae]|uniref:ATP phosphoribosyltransferase regulatory subunit n=1 Tax=Pueribacillus theae TaxID=2171751 RepID=A0A2U1K6R4_9BACI|nr:ATP phosphoribosyltransferase regulatory subunit [Pueribacillus theae]PWA12653.1 ATP phosphoribosyltransferase regulatory subunit [Pueribacillus theae]
MSKPLVFEKPLGMHDTLPALYETKKRIRTKIASFIQSWGYQFIETPTLEYYDTVGAASAMLEKQLFKLLDQEGNPLVLRPDMTAPIARVAGSSLKNAAYPLRLAYDSHLFQAQQREGGRPAEYEQIGIELIGDGTRSADAEVIALMIAALKEAGLENFKVAVGHVGFMNKLFLDVVGTQERAEALRKFLNEKNYVGYREHVKQLKLSSIDERRLLALLGLRGRKETVDEAMNVIDNYESEAALKELQSLWSILEAYDVASDVTLDLTLVRHISYYTGIVFEAYAEGLGSPLAGGGRYDELLEKFNRPAQATGFGIRLDHLIEALDGEEVEAPISCLIFTKEHQAEAIAKAKEMRERGKRVVLQDLSGVADIDALTARYDDISFCIGKKGKENGS